MEGLFIVYKIYKNKTLTKCNPYNIIKVEKGV